ncbi:MAG: hydroxymethylglutaryl-CoA lyase [Saprospiraceae bacterium]|nr:hydroxymethylglutaryl-CoA lyase [Saprospiraceae bacterium]
MQGLHYHIPTAEKVAYINALLKVGFHTIDFGSFVSPKAIPQLADTKAVVDQLDLDGTETKLLAIIANLRGAQDAAAFEQIAYLGFPFSVSETFQQRNTNASQSEALNRLQDIQNLCEKHNKQLVAYLSMGFGNPYGDPWDVEAVEKWVEQLYKIGIRIMPLADTVGVANPGSIHYLFSNLIPAYPDVEFGAHFHSHPNSWEDKIEAALEAGCARFDTTIKGIGGCPMAEDDLVGNIDTLNVLQFFEAQGRPRPLNLEALAGAEKLAGQIFL